VTVVDVQIKDGYIHHILAKEPTFAEGDTVFGEIDWEHRFSNMQQHSGEHLFSGVVCGTFGYDNVGFHLSDSNKRAPPRACASAGTREAAGRSHVLC
jgi:alanyl-tRNA synthetase